MTTLLIYAGIALVVTGSVALLLFSAKQKTAQMEQERMPHRWSEVKQGLVHKRILSRGIIVLGIIVLIISLIFQ